MSSIKTPTPIACALCKKKQYVDAQAMKKDWGMHQKECNCYAEDQGVTLAVPYMYEDVAPSDALDQLPAGHAVNQSYMVTVFNTDGTLESRIIPTAAGVYSEDPSLERERVPQPFQKGDSLTITLKDLTSGTQSAPLNAELPYNSVSLDNEHNAHSARMAGQYMKGHLAPFGEGMTLRTRYNQIAWPAPQETQRALSSVPLTQQHLYELQLTQKSADEAEPTTTTQQFRILLDKMPPVGKQMQQSKLGRFYNHMVKVQANAANTHVILDRAGTFRMMTSDGSVVVLQVEMVDGVAHITDVQVMRGYGHRGTPRYNPSPGRGLPKGVYGGRLGLAQRMGCDPAKLEDVTALRMALKNRIAEYADVLDVMRAANTNPECQIIRQTAQKLRHYEGHLKQLDGYRENLHRHGPEVADAQPQMGALIGRILQDQHEFIGAKMKEQTYSSKLLKDGEEAAKALTNEAIRRYKDAQESVRKADQDIANSKARSKAGKTGTKLKEGAKRVALNAKKAAAILKKRKAEATMKDISAALQIAAGSPLVTSQTVRTNLEGYIRKLRDAKSRTGLSPEAEEEIMDGDDEGDDEYMHGRRMRNYSY